MAAAASAAQTTPRTAQVNTIKATVPTYYRVVLRQLPFTYQTFNNCGPASLASVLGYYGVRAEQASIARVAKADPRGYMTADVIDSVVAPFGLRAQRFRRGGIDDVRQLVGKGIPVIVLQWLRSGSSIPHFRVVTGFDDASATMTVLDPLYGPQVSISYAQFTTLWQVYDSEFIPVYPLQWDAYVRRLLGV